MLAELLGHRYHYETSGRVDGEAVLFVHGFSQSLRTWDAVRSRLEASYFTAACDLIGHGASDRPPRTGPYSIGHQAEAIDALRETLGIERMHLVGYSMGGRLALAYAGLHPDRVASLVLESASPGPRSDAERESARKGDRELRARLGTFTSDEFARYWEALPLFETQRHLPERIIGPERASRRANDTAALARAVEGAGQGRMPDLWDALGNLAGPGAMFVGTFDSRYRDIAREANERFGIPVVEFAAGHNVHLERADEFSTALLAHLKTATEGER